jgi:hypothetical protein
MCDRASSRASRARIRLTIATRERVHRRRGPSCQLIGFIGFAPMFPAHQTRARGESAALNWCEARPAGAVGGC